MIKLFEQFNDEQEIYYMCTKYRIINYTINDDGSIDVDGDVNLGHQKLNKLPLNFNRVSGNFICNYNHLTSLEGSPNYVGGAFSCSYNKLTTLEDGPYEVGGYYFCQSNRLTSLKGISSEIGTDLNISFNNINKIDIEFNINGNYIDIENTNLDNKIKGLSDYYKKMLFRYGLDYKIFNEDGSINDKQLQHFIKDFKE